MKLALNIICVSPSGTFEKNDVDFSTDLLEKKGINIVSKTQKRNYDLGYLNGSDEARIEELQNALSSQECDFIWHARGGYGLTRLLPALSLPERTPPKVIGFSDASALLLHLWKHKRLKGIHGPMLNRLRHMDHESLDVLWRILNGQARSLKWPLLENVSDLQPGEVSGELITANLCVLTHLVGTDSMPPLKGAILVLEDVAEKPYRIDRMLTQLWHSGSLIGIKAIVLGQFTGCDHADAPTTEEVIKERCSAFGIPLFSGLPVGHNKNNWAIPFGVSAKLIISDTVQLKILEEVT